MEKNNSGILDFIQLILVIIFLLVLTIINVSDMNKMDNKLDNISYKIKFIERQPMCDGMKENGSVSNGYYKHDNYYCVWTKDRTIEEINRTDVHEVCHELIHKDTEGHFCGK